MAGFFEVEAENLVEPLLRSLGDGSISISHLLCPEGISYELVFDGDSKNITVSGEVDNDRTLALRGALVAIMVGIRETFGIYVGDYSYFKMQESYGLLVRVLNTLNSLCGDFNRMMVAAHSYLKAVMELSNFLMQFRIELPWYKSKKAEIGNAAAKMLELREPESAMKSFALPSHIVRDVESFIRGMEGETLKFSMRESYYVVNEIFREVMHSDFGLVPNVSARSIGGSGFESTVYLVDGHKIFTGSVREDELSANVDVMLSVMGYVENCFGKPIRDITFEMLGSIRTRIASFDSDSRFILSKGLLLFVATRRCHEVASTQVEDLIEFAERAQLPLKFRDNMLETRSKLGELFRGAQMLLDVYDRPMVTLEQLRNQ